MFAYLKKYSTIFFGEVYHFMKVDNKKHPLLQQDGMKSIRQTSGALFVALGIFLSRISGLIRERAFAHFFGNSLAADAFKAALKIPNFLQNLFGEGVLSASFIPVYAKLLVNPDDSHSQQASQLASVIGSMLFVIISFFVLIGVLLSPQFVLLIAPGFTGEKYDLTVQLVQVFFPGTGLLVMSAWCLGILNSHKKFFLSYFAPVLWNLSIIAALLVFGYKQPQIQLALTTAWGLVIGSFLQFFVQIPMVFKLAPHVHLTFRWGVSSAKMVIKNFVPVVFSRGVVQVSSFIDSILASFLPLGAVSAIAYAQSLYMLPLSLFGMSVAASELPQMSQIVGTEDEVMLKTSARLNRGLRRIVFFVLPSMVAFLTMGDSIVGLLFQTGAFGKNDTRDVWFILIGYSVGLLASALARLYSAAFYAFHDTRTPLKFAIYRVMFAATFSLVSILYLTKIAHVEGAWAGVGITLVSGLSSWIEYYLLKKKIQIKMKSVGIDFNFMRKIFLISVASAIVAIAARSLLVNQNFLPIFFIHFATIALFGVIFFAFQWKERRSFW